MTTAVGQRPAQAIAVHGKADVEVSSLGLWTSEADQALSHTASSNFLTASPYTEQEHLLDLRTVDTENALLAKALVHLKPLRPDYATSPYRETFNWPEIIEEIRSSARAADHKWKKTSFFVVAFRSRIPRTTVYAELGKLDKAAHAEAMASGGFLKYWFGFPDEQGRNLATCMWRSLEDARRGGVGPAHRKAAGAARHLYAEWKIERLRLIIREDVESWDIESWTD